MYTYIHAGPYLSLIMSIFQLMMWTTKPSDTTSWQGHRWIFGYLNFGLLKKYGDYLHHLGCKQVGEAMLIWLAGFLHHIHPQNLTFGYQKSKRLVGKCIFFQRWLLCCIYWSNFVGVFQAILNKLFVFRWTFLVPVSQSPFKTWVVAVGWW